MKRFTNLFLELDHTNRTNEKVELLKSYFLTAPDEDKIWALALFTGRRPPRKVKTAQMQAWAMEQAGIPEWLFKESYHSVGDLGETISRILPAQASSSDRSLADWFAYLARLNDADDHQKKDLIIEAWRELSPFEIFVFNKLLMGSFRIGVSQTLVIRAIAEAVGLEPAVITHRVMGRWDPFETTFHGLVQAENGKDQDSRPYPFYLAYSIEGPVSGLGEPQDWLAEWKWDGIRSQLIWRNGELYIWSRGEELVTDKFPELHAAKNRLPEGTVLDGEILCFENNKPLPFNVLQTRIGRKNITQKVLAEAPVVFMAYDLLELDGQDVRPQPQQERRRLMEQLFSTGGLDNPFILSPLLSFSDWEELEKLHLQSREQMAEGFMIKRKEAPYLTGRKKGDWWKWKVDPLSVDAVMVYAMKGHGRRAELYTDYTFAVWDGDHLIPFAKAYSGLTDKEIREVDTFIKNNTLEKFGPVRTVKPELVFEIGFEGINASTRHKSGIAVRFPRILNWRHDKAAAEADTLENLRNILEVYK